MKTEFFRINLPYGIEKTAKGTWRCFNRDYSPLGFSREECVFGEHVSRGLKFNDLPYVFLFSLADQHSFPSVVKNDSGEPVRIFFYSDNSNPAEFPEFWEEYSQKLKALAQFDCD